MNSRQIQNLRRTRDLLLPRLLSGGVLFLDKENVSRRYTVKNA